MTRDGLPGYLSTIVRAKIQSKVIYIFPKRTVVIALEPYMEDPIEKSYQKPVIIKFIARWCKPCKSIGTQFILLSEQYNTSALFYRVDLEKNKLFAKHFAVHSVPTFVVLHKGRIEKRVNGPAIEDVKEIIDQLVRAETRSSEKRYTVL